MMAPAQFALGTSEADLFTLDTAQGRARLFKKRLDDLMRPRANGTLPTMDDALFEMRTGGNADDQALLQAMGETTGAHRTEKLKQEKFNKNMDRWAEENAKAKLTSPEVKAATARNVAFNARITELTDRGLTTDQAIVQMRANASDAALLKAMGRA